MQQQPHFFQRKEIQLIGVVVILQLIIALLTNTMTFTHEESMWHYIGRNWFRHGLTPYSGGIDNKSPLIFAIYGLSDWLFGINIWFPRLLGTAVEAIGIYYLYRIAKQLAGEKAGLLAISVYGLSLLWRTTGGKLVSFTETYATTFVIISFYQCLVAEKGKKYFIAGILSGIAFGFRFSAAFGILAILIMAIRKKVSGGIYFAIGVLIGCGLIALLLELMNVRVVDFLDYGFTDNFGQGSTTDFSWQYKLEGFTNNFFYSELILFYPFVIGYILIVRKFDKLLVWLLCTFIGLNILGLYARPHFKEMLPALSLTTALTLAWLTEQKNVSFKGLMIVTWIAFFPKTLEPLWGMNKLLRPAISKVNTDCDNLKQADEEAEKRLGLWIRSVTSDTDLVYVAGYGARVQLYSERISPALYFNITQNQRSKKQLYDDLIKHPPTLIAVPVFSTYISYVDQDVRLFVDNYLRNYHDEGCLHGYRIYRRSLAEISLPVASAASTVPGDAPSYIASPAK